MTSRSAPRTATWFLYQFGAGLENDAAIGDLAEKYQLGGSRGWYWRQVLSIVIGGLNHDVRRDKAWVWRGIAAAWLIHTLLMVEAGHLLRAYFDVLHQSSTINLFPLVTLKAGNGAVQQWVAVVPTIVLNILILLFLGRMLTMSRRIPPQTMVRIYIAFCTLATIGSAGLSLITLLFNRPNSLGFLVISVLALPAAPTLLLIGSGFFFRRTPSPAGILE